LNQRVKEGVTWYPVRLLRDYIGTGERLLIEYRNKSLISLTLFKWADGSVFSNAGARLEKSREWRSELCAGRDDGDHPQWR